jgi:hypothetical protein
VDDAVDIPFGLPSESHERLHLAGEQNTSIRDGVVERLDPESVPGSKQQPPFDVVQDESKLAAKIRHEVKAIAYVSAGLCSISNRFGSPSLIHTIARLARCRTLF